MLAEFHTVAFTHRTLEVLEVGKLHIDPEQQQERLQALKEEVLLDELMFLSTCNRVEFLFCHNGNVDRHFLSNFLQKLYPEWEASLHQRILDSAEILHGMDAVEHLLRVASSIDSMVVGEREIITQVRSAFENCKAYGLTGDFIRIVLRHTIETAKRVYTETNIATKPVSVVALAYHTLRNLQIDLDARVLMVGAGMTNANMAKFLKKHGFKSFAVFNRTFEKAKKLAEDLGGEAYPLEILKEYDKGFDIMITCTGSDHHLITPEIYSQLAGGEEKSKVVIDLAIPQDLNPEICQNFAVNHISIEQLQRISEQNLKERSKEITHVEEILKEAIFEFRYIERARKVELAMRQVPAKVKEIKQTALTHVFKHDLDTLDENSREVLEKVMGYVEKKYMSVPMIMAKEILLKEEM